MEAKASSRSPKGHKEDGGEDDDRFIEARDGGDTGRREEDEKRGKITAAHGLALDLPEGAPRDRGQRSVEDKILNRLESQVLVVFELPDGSTGEEEFKIGQTVDVLKSYVEREFSIPMAQQQLYYEGRLMLDPLSIADYTVDTDNPIFVRVEGEMEDDAKK